MNRLTIGLAVALGLAVATVAGLLASSNASAGSFHDGLKCYRVQHVQSQNSGGQLIYISDQFEEKNLVIKKPISFCDMAEKPDGGTYLDPLTNLMCYAIKDAPGQSRFRSVEILTEDQFTGNHFTVTKPYSLCEPADKQVITTTGTAAGDGLLDDFAFMCYRVRRHENGDNRFEKVEVEVIDQFSGKELRLGRPNVFCTQVWEKKNKAKNDHIDHARLLSSPEDEHHASTISTGRDRSDPRTDCASSYGHSVWYTYSPQDPDDEVVSLDTFGSTYDTVLAVYDDQLNEIDCNDDYNFPDSGDSQVTVKLEYGHKYYIMVGAFGSDQGGKLKLHLNVEGSCASCTFPDPEPDAVAAGQATPEAPSQDQTTVAAVKDAPVEVAGEEPLNLTCYSISQRAPEDALLQTYDQLNAHQFTVGRGIMYCTPADKCIFLDQQSMVQNVAGDPQVSFCKVTKP